MNQREMDMDNQTDDTDVNELEETQNSEDLPDSEMDIAVLADQLETTDGTGDEDAKEQRYKIYRERIKHFTLMNDPLIRQVFDDDATVEYLLSIVMEKPDLKVISKTIQADYKNLTGRSVTMDIVAKDNAGIVYNVEIQQKSAGAVPERARYNAGMVDSKELHTGEDFTKLPNSYVIFITDKDETDHILSDETIPVARVSKGFDEPREAIDTADPNSPYLHRIVRVDELTGRIFKDRQTIIYICSRMPAGTDLGNLMHDFRCENPDDMICEPMSRRVKMIKESKKEVDHMCVEMDRLYNEGETIGEKRGQVRVALNMLKEDYTVSQIARATELTVTEVQQLVDRKKQRESLQLV